MFAKSSCVIPAKAGIHFPLALKVLVAEWIPAFAGMTWVTKLLTLLLIILSLSACQTMAPVDKKKTSAAEINIQLGMAYLERHEIQRAKQKFITALHQAPSLPETWYSLGYFFEVTGDKQRATRCYMKSVELAPKRGDTNNNYGTYLCRSHQYKEAVKYFLVATQDVEYLDTAAAYENAGLCAELIPDNRLAVQYFELALKQDPSRAPSMLSLAELSYKQGQYGTAKSWLAQFLAISAPTPESLALSAKLRSKI